MQPPAYCRACYTDFTSLARLFRVPMAASDEACHMFTREFVSAGRISRFTVTRGPQGWHVREEHDTTVVRSLNLEDWHRVERAIQRFEQSRPERAKQGD
jgi:hypothetical protein